MKDRSMGGFQVWWPDQNFPLLMAGCQEEKGKSFSVHAVFPVVLN